MTDAAFGGRAFEPPTFPPPWLRPAAIAAVVALHAAAISILPDLAPKPPEKPREVVVDVEPEAASPQPEPAAPALPPPEEVRPPPPLPPVAAPPPEPAPPVVEAPPPVSVSPPPPPEPPPPAPVELAPPKFSPPPPRVEPPKPRPLKLAPKPAPAEPKPAQAQPKPTPKPRPAPSAASAAPAAASAASQSAYVSAMAAAIRSRLFYPPAARARGAKGVVDVAFAIGPSGALASFAITHSSGDEDLDAAARTLVQSAHFPPPPGGSVHVSTSFNYVPR